MKLLIDMSKLQELLSRKIKPDYTFTFMSNLFEGIEKIDRFGWEDDIEAKFTIYDKMPREDQPVGYIDLVRKNPGRDYNGNIMPDGTIKWSEPYKI